MPLYLLPAKGDRTVGIEPDFPAGVTAPSWAGVYDEGSHQYVIRAEEPVDGLTELEPGEDVGFAYSNLEQAQIGAAPAETDDVAE